MVNLVVGGRSVAGSAQLAAQNMEEDYVITGQSKVFTSTHMGEASISPGFPLQKQKTSTEDLVESGVNRVAGLIAMNGGLNGPLQNTFHAMSMDPKFPGNYPALVANRLTEILNTDDQNSILISYHAKHTKDNPNGSHVRYGAREKKDEIEQSFLKEIKLGDRKIVDLLIFDSPSAKAIGFTFLGVVAQVMDYLGRENKLLENFLGNKDYNTLYNFFQKYPLKGNLKEGQKSMMDMSDEEFKSVMNTLVSDVNCAKLSYISGVISDIYIKLAMKYLEENREEILKTEGDRFLLDWETISADGETEEVSDYIMESMSELLDKLTVLDPAVELREKYSHTGNIAKIVGLDRKEKPKVLNGLFYQTGKSSQNVWVSYAFNPTEENFALMGDEKEGGHFGFNPLFMAIGLAYGSPLMQENESVSLTKGTGATFLGEEITLERRGDQIFAYNKNKPGESYAEFAITRDEKDLGDSKTGVIISEGMNDFNRNLVPHGQGWFEKFTASKVPNIMGINPKATVLETAGVKIADKFFINPTEEDLVKIPEVMREKHRTQFAKNENIFQGKYRSLKSEYSEDFAEKIQGDIQVKVTRVSYYTPNLAVNIEILDDTGKVICRGTCTFF